MSKGKRSTYGVLLLIVSGGLTGINLYRLVHETSWTFFFTFIAIGILAGLLATIASDILEETK